MIGCPGDDPGPRGPWLPDGVPSSARTIPRAARAAQRRREVPMGVSRGSGGWDGDLKTGKGFMRPAHGTDLPFTVGSRFEGQPQSNPEELIGAALSGCFSMALAANLGGAGKPPTRIRTSADVTIEKQSVGFTITTIALTTEAVVPGIEAAKFQEIAEVTKKTCPVSKVLAAARISLVATLKT